MNNDDTLPTILRSLAHMLENMEQGTPIPIVRGITEKRFSEYSGLSCSALQKARSTGKHPSSVVWFKDTATGRILYDIEGYNSWLESTRQVITLASKQPKQASGSRSSSKASNTVKLLSKDLLKRT